jgi:restriction endonuclease S subunit
MTKYKLAQLAEIKYGKDHKKLGKGSVPVYGTGGIMRYVNDFIYEGESVLIPRKGSLNNLFYVHGKFWTVDTIFWTKIDSKIVLPRYLYYYLSRIDLTSYNVGSAVPSLTISLLNELVLDIPPISVQKDVVNKLTAIENKIKINEQINDNLFKLAKIHFDRQLDSENIKFSQISTIQNGYAFKSKEYVDTNELMILRTKNINDNHLFSKNDVVYISKELFDEYKKFSFSAFDTVLVMVGASIGKTGFVTSNMTPSLQNQNMWRFRPKMSNIPGLLIFQYVNYINKHIIGSATGSARSFYRKKLFSEFEVPRINSTNYIYFDTLQREIDHLNTENEILYRIKHSLLNHYF